MTAAGSGAGRSPAAQRTNPRILCRGRTLSYAWSVWSFFVRLHEQQEAQIDYVGTERLRMTLLALVLLTVGRRVADL